MTAAPAPATSPERPLLWSTLVVAACGIVYELLLATLASWLLGDTLREFAMVLGGFLASMGLGAALTGRVQRRAALGFVAIELGLAAIGGLAAPLALALSNRPHALRGALLALVLLLGAMVGAELPLLLHLLRPRLGLRERVAAAFFADYAGGLVASLMFPLALVPWLGLARTGFAVAGLNALVALAATSWLAAELGRARVPLRVLALALGAAALVGVQLAPQVARLADL